LVTASSIGIVIERWIALGEAPFHRVVIVSWGSSVSGIA